MKMRHYCLLLVMMLSVSAFAQKQSYESMWKEVDAFELSDLPRSIIKVTDDILAKAVSEKNSPQMLKAFIYRANTNLRLDADSLHTQIKGIVKWEQTTQNQLDKAILNSILAELYADYVNNHFWNLQQRSDVLDTSSTDMSEWGKQEFAERISKAISASIKEKDLLLNTSTQGYQAVVKQGTTSDYYKHNFYQLLATRSFSLYETVNRLNREKYPQKYSFLSHYFDSTDEFMNHSITPSNNNDVLAIRMCIYQNLLSFYRSKGYDEAVILTERSRLDCLNTLLNEGYDYKLNDFSVKMYKKKLFEISNSLLAKYASNPLSVEVALFKIEQLMSNNKYVLALQLANETIAKFPKYKRINAVIEKRETILSPDFSANMPQVIYPNSTFELKILHKNLNGFTVNIYSVPSSVNQNDDSYLRKKLYQMDKKLVSTVKYSLIPSTDYQLKDTIIKVTAPQVGLYVVEVSPNAKLKLEDAKFVACSAIKVLTRQIPNDKLQIVTLDSKTGQPIADANVSMIKNKKGKETKIIDLRTDKIGDLIVDKNQYDQAKVTKELDVALPNVWLNNSPYYFTEPRIKEKSEYFTILTDRGLYRPGQTVYAKGIAYTTLGDKAQVLAKKEYKIELCDASGKQIAVKSVRTNEFGSCTAEFVLPANSLNGNFSLKSDEGSVTIRVEEYKRPTFELDILPLNGNYSFNDSVTVKGNAKMFSGAALSGSIIKYKINRNKRNWWSRFNNDTNEIVQGEVKVNTKGEFNIPFCLVADTLELDQDSYYSYEVNASLTDGAGETQTAQIWIGVGTHSVVLSVNNLKEICKDKAIEMTFNADNLSGQPVSVKGTYQLFEKSKKVALLTGEFSSNKAQELSAWQNLPSGEYKLVLSANDEKGRKSTFEGEFTLFSINDKKSPASKPMWCKLMNDTFSTNEPATILFGSKEKELYVLYDVFADGKQIDSRKLQFSDEVQRFVFPYKEEYGDGVYVNFCFVHNGEVYQEGVRITKPFPDTKLDLKWDVFRDKLRPGQKEIWKLTIKDTKSAAAKAELMAKMYDASLDKLWINYQGLGLFFNRSVSRCDWNSSFKQNLYYEFVFEKKSYRYNPLSFDELFSKVLYERERINKIIKSSAKAKFSAPVIKGDSEASDELSGPTVFGTKSVVRKMMTGSATEGEPAYKQMDANDGKPSNIPIRENFNETAFFYPQLRTNEKGEVSFEFTMPESLTRWKFTGIAHTKEMKTGDIEAETVTSKDFMISPNMPRFVRVGDKTSIAARIINLSDKEIKAEVKMQLFDPSTEMVLSTQREWVIVKAGEITHTSFNFVADESQSLLGCRLIADGGSFSDGEQQLLPVLSNKQLLTETIAMPIRGNQTREFSLKELFNKDSKTATNRKLTVEFTGNPAWMALQSLPSLANPTNENAISWVTAYYANSIAASIMNAQPRLKAVFEQWKSEGVTKETLWSNLQKNQDVKNILLEESPWLTDANTEAEQKQRLATLFDLNTVQYKNTQAIDKLKDLQFYDGSWSWYKGMNGNRYITQFVLETLGRLTLLTNKPLDAEINEMQQRAFKYLHYEMATKYKAIKNRKDYQTNSYGLDDESLNYLYLCALTNQSIPAKAKEAYSYFLSRVSTTITNQTLMGKAISAVVLSKAGRKNEADAFMNSIKEYAIHTDEMGMHYSSSVNPYSWYGNRMNVQTAVLEALDIVSHDEASVEEMKIWILKQKQTQTWDSPLSTVNAVYALLKRGTDLLANKGNVELTFAQQVIRTNEEPKSDIPAIGYIKKSFDDAASTTKLDKITVVKKDAGVAWGAVYAQYQELTDKIQQQGKELNVTKQLYVERTINGAKVLLPIATTSDIKVGEKIVSRLVMKVDRDMDFVQLKDQRAACCEPLEALSGYHYSSATSYYVSIKDASTNFFFDSLNKGTYVLEYTYVLTRSGNYSSGIATLQSAYAPEFASHSSSERVVVK